MLFIIYHPDGIASAGHFCAFVTEIPVGVWYTLFKRAAGRPGSRCREPRRSSGQGLERFAATPNALLLDVRTQEEYADGHIPESRNLPLQTLGRTELLPPARETPLFVYCLSGVRSRQAAGLLRRMGYTDVTDLGGICNYRGKVVK